MRSSIEYPNLYPPTLAAIAGLEHGLFKTGKERILQQSDQYTPLPRKLVANVNEHDGLLSR